MADVSVQEIKNTADGIGKVNDVEATTDGTLIAILKRIRTLIGQSVKTIGSTIGTTGSLMLGSDGTNARAIKTSADGTMLTQLTGNNVLVANTWTKRVTVQTIAVGGALDVDYTLSNGYEFCVVISLGTAKKYKVDSRFFGDAYNGAEQMQGPITIIDNATSSASFGTSQFKVIYGKRIRITITNSDATDIIVTLWTKER